MKFSLLYVTHENEEEARKIVSILLSENLIACANIFPIQFEQLSIALLLTADLI